MEENIFEAHARIYKKLIFFISCYDTDYAMQYVSNLNNKTFKHFFKIFKLDTPEEINEIVEKIPKKQLIIVTKLPSPHLYSFDFIKDVHHIHIAIPLWKTGEKVEYNKYVDDIKNITVQKFVNVKEKKIDMMIELKISYLI